MKNMMKKIFASITIAALVGAGFVVSAYAEGTVLPPDDGGVTITPDSGGETPSEPPIEPELPPAESMPEYKIWVTMPETGIKDGKPVPTDKKVSYGYQIITCKLTGDEVISAFVSMERKTVKEYVAVEVTTEIQKLIGQNVAKVLLIVCYDDKVYKGDPIVEILYEGDGTGEELFRTYGTIHPDVLNLGSQREDIMMKIHVEGAETPKDIELDTVKITKIGGNEIEPVFGELIDPAPTVNKKFLIIFFDTEKLMENIPQGVSVVFCVAGSFKDGETFECNVSARVIKPAGQKIINKNGGYIKAGGVEIDVPGRALHEEVLITVDPEINNEAHAANAASSGKAEYILRKKTAKNQELALVNGGVQFGPEGLVFRNKVRIELEYPDGKNAENLKIFYWNKNTCEWEEVPGTEPVEGKNRVAVMISHFSIYQIMELPDVERPDVPSIDIGEFTSGEIYCYPNPAKYGAFPVIHVETGIADKVSIHIFDAAGMLIHQAELTGAPEMVNNKYAYEYRWDIGGVASGVYLCSIRAVKKGYADMRAIRKIAVIK